MDSGATAVNDFEYTVHDCNGIVGVDKEGNEHPISEEEWQKAHPEHKNTECKECIFVQDSKSLFTFFVSRDLKEKATEKPVFVGKFTMPNWVGHAGFYVFRCGGCREVCVDYLHGYSNGSYCYFYCGECLLQLVITSDFSWGEEIYAREGIVAPPKSRKHFTNYLKFLRDFFS